MHISRAASAVLLVAGCSASSATPQAPRPFDAPAARPAAPGDAITALRAQGPAALDRLLADYDAMGAADPGRARMEATIDAVAGQRYATISRLYWYTDLEAARAAARAEGRPILSLRMLGRLDQDWSCANSRFFRVALYANTEVSAFLRDRYVLHWSTEREVPRVTVDFGDGRKLETTIAGNSAHYVLDADGRPVDVLPGLWGPKAFVAELEAAAPVAIRAGQSDGAERAGLLAQHHAARMVFAQQRWRDDGSARLALAGLPPGDASLLEAERTTVSKAMVESPVVTGARLGREVARIPDHSDIWQQIGRAHADESRLDERSRALIARLVQGGWGDERAVPGTRAFEAVVASFESMIAGDTALNRNQIRWPIHGWFTSQEAVTTDLAALNARIYAELFLTPAADPWLGMATPGVFTGLPGDGIVAAKR